VDGNCEKILEGRGCTSGENDGQCRCLPGWKPKTQPKKNEYSILPYSWKYSRDVFSPENNCQVIEELHDKNGCLLSSGFDCIVCQEDYFLNTARKPKSCWKKSDHKQLIELADATEWGKKCE